ncbi:hypothetical protein ADK96_05320 [Streptomyces sp. IGB124]|nr:hypothetical protein ADK96_05320 [Streptomyces sp. IGB124]
MKPSVSDLRNLASEVCIARAARDRPLPTSMMARPAGGQASATRAPTKPRIAEALERASAGSSVILCQIEDRRLGSLGASLSVAAFSVAATRRAAAACSAASSRARRRTSVRASGVFAAAACASYRAASSRWATSVSCHPVSRRAASAREVWAEAR